MEALELEQEPRAREKYFLFSKTKSTFWVKLELDVGGIFSQIKEMRGFSLYSESRDL